MNRSELIEAIAKATTNTKADTDRFLEAFTNVVQVNIKKGEGVRLMGFGTFLTIMRKARTARNPQTGQQVEIPAITIPKFRPGSQLREAAKI